MTLADTLDTHAAAAVRDPRNFPALTRAVQARRAALDAAYRDRQPEPTSGTLSGWNPGSTVLIVAARDLRVR